MTNVNVTMNVATPDVRSFRQSQDQMLQELEGKLRKSVKRIGSSLQVDDPTRRAE